MHAAVVSRIAGLGRCCSMREAADASCEPFDRWKCRCSSSICRVRCRSMCRAAANAAPSRGTDLIAPRPDIDSSKSHASHELPLPSPNSVQGLSRCLVSLLAENWPVWAVVGGRGRPGEAMAEAAPSARRRRCFGKTSPQQSSILEKIIANWEFFRVYTSDDLSRSKI